MNKAVAKRNFILAGKLQAQMDACVETAETVGSSEEEESSDEEEEGSDDEAEDVEGDEKKQKSTADEKESTR